MAMKAATSTYWSAAIHQLHPVTLAAEGLLKMVYHVPRVVPTIQSVPLVTALQMMITFPTSAVSCFTTTISTLLPPPPPSLSLLPCPFSLVTVTSYTADNTEDVCIGSDPHFGIRLPEGSLLCYTFQGEHNSTFNIISNSQLEMNALFVPDSRRVNNTWIGSIGITVYHNGKKMTTLQFIAADKMIVVESRIELDAYTVGKITFNQGRFTVVYTSHRTSSFPRVTIEFQDSDLKFTVAFVRDEHINLEWHSVGVPYMDSRGVVGKQKKTRSALSLLVM